MVFPVLGLALALGSGDRGVLAGSLTGLFFVFAEWFRCSLGLRRIRALPYVHPPPPVQFDEEEKEHASPAPSAVEVNLAALQLTLKPRDVRMNWAGRIAFAAGGIGPIVISITMLLRAEAWFLLLPLLFVFPLSITLWTFLLLRRQRRLMQMGEATMGVVTDVGDSSLFYRFEVSGGESIKGFARGGNLGIH